MTYLLAASVYLAMIASLGPLFPSHRDDSLYGRNPPWWPIPITVAVAWGVLWSLYRRWRLRQALTVHKAGPLIALALVALATVLGTITFLTSLDPDPRGPVAFVAAMGALLLTGCGVSSLVSLPAATLMLVYLALRPKR
jgi:hypothetical protein